jgi:hypothetical protein
MNLYPYDRTDQRLNTDVLDKAVDRAFVAHLQIPAASAIVADTDGIHAAFACTTPAIAATCVVKAASAETDILTTTIPATIGAAANALSILLMTAADDALAVSKNDTTKVITIAIAKTTAANNTATLIQAAIRALSTVGDVSVASATCAAGGDWDTAAIATGETAAVAFSGGQTAANDVLTTAITNPGTPRNITATVGGTAGDIKAVQVIVAGTNYNGEIITETLPVFTVDTAGTVSGSKAFATITSITIPAHDGTGATTSIGFGEALGLPYKLAHNTVLEAYLANVKEATAPTVAISATALESNTIDLYSALNGSIVDIYLLV